MAYFLHHPVQSSALYTN